jgi:hypothetical protein
MGIGGIKWQQHDDHSPPLPMNLPGVVLNLLNKGTLHLKLFFLIPTLVWRGCRKIKILFRTFGVPANIQHTHFLNKSQSVTA